MNTAPDACCSRTQKRRTRAAWLSIFPAAVALLAPKCPFCLAAYLSLIGLGAGTAGVLAPILRPFGIALLTLALLTLVVTYARRTLLSETGAPRR